MQFVRTVVAAGLTATLTLAVAAPVRAQNRAGFEAELNRLAAQLAIPSLSAAVVEGGTVVWVRHIGTNVRRGEPVRYPIGGLTEAFTAALAMKLVAEKKLTLDAPVDTNAKQPVPLQHVLSHTAAGTPAARFVYSSALYQRAGPVLARAAGVSSVGAALQAQLLRPLRLTNTSVRAGTTAGDGLESTVEDVARLAIALDAGTVAPRSLTSTLFQPGRDAAGLAHPFGIGWFVQSVGGQQVRWQFGSRPDGSALMLTLPGRRVTLVVLARGNRLSVPFWLAFGDVRWSAIATAFLSNWTGIKQDLPEARHTMIEALIALGSSRAADGAKLAEKAAGLAPGLVNAPDGALLAAFARSRQPALWEMGEIVARRLLAVDADHPRTLLDLAVLRISAGKADEGRGLIQKLLAGRQATPEIEAEAKQLAK